MVDGFICCMWGLLQSQSMSTVRACQSGCMSQAGTVSQEWLKVARFEKVWAAFWQVWQWNGASLYIRGKFIWANVGLPTQVDMLQVSLGKQPTGEVDGLCRECTVPCLASILLHQCRLDLYTIRGLCGSSWSGMLKWWQAGNLNMS
jgi:hypothetical protein